MEASGEGRSAPENISRPARDEGAANRSNPVSSPEKSPPEVRNSSAGAPSVVSGAPSPARRRPRRLMLLAGVVVVAVAGFFLTPVIRTALDTVSTYDAYVNGHVTFVAPRVAGQVSGVLVDDNMRVKRGDVLVQLDKEPYQVQVAIKQAAVEAAERDFARGQTLVAKGAISQQEFDEYKAALEVARNRVGSAEQTIQQTRTRLGLPINYENPLDAPENLDQKFSTVREALGALQSSAAQLGFSPSTYEATPKQAIEEFYKQDPEGNLDRIYARLIPESPGVKQAEARLLQARRDLDLAELDLRYCDIVSEIDGVVTRRNVNPGNHVQVGQALLAVRSLTEIWIDANFKETQLGELRIGQPVRCEVDMYGKRGEFKGRITGFAMGTGSTLALLPPQNATGNFVKVVQRVPVRIELDDYDPDQTALLIGLSCVPYVYIHEPLVGDDPGKGRVLQDYALAKTARR